MTNERGIQELVLDVEITEKDILDFRYYHLSHSRIVRGQVRRVVSVILVVWVGLLALMVFTSPKPLSAAKDLWPLLTGPPLFLVTFPLIHRWRLRRVSKKVFREGRNRAMLGRMKLTLSEKGIGEVGQFSDTFFRHEAMEKVITTSTAIYIYVGSAIAIIAPRRAFGSDEAFAHFAKTAQEHLTTN